MIHTIVYYRDRRKKWRWRLLARNGRIVADSGEGYTRKFDCRAFFNRLVSGKLLVKERVG